MRHVRQLLRVVIVLLVLQLGPAPSSALYAEEPTKLMAMKKTSSGKLKPGWDYRKDFVAADIRFTQSKAGKTLYATALNWPEDGSVSPDSQFS